MIIVNCKQLEGKSKYCPDIYLDKLSENINFSSKQSATRQTVPLCVCGTFFQACFCD